MAMSLDSSIPPVGLSGMEKEVTGPEEGEKRDSNDYTPQILCVRAQVLDNCGDAAHALQLYDNAVNLGYSEASIFRGFLKAEMALKGNSIQEFIMGLREALIVIAKSRTNAYTKRLYRLLCNAADTGFINRERQLCVEDADESDIRERIFDFIVAGGGEKASLENLLEYLDAYFSSS